MGSHSVRFFILREWMRQDDVVKFVVKPGACHRPMKPSLYFRLTGLYRDIPYRCSLTMKRVDDFEYEMMNGEWVKIGNLTKAPLHAQVIHHIDGAKLGHLWMSEYIDFFFVSFLKRVSRGSFEHSMIIQENVMNQFEGCMHGPTTLRMRNPKLKFIPIAVVPTRQRHPDVREQTAVNIREDGADLEIQEPLHRDRVKQGHRSGLIPSSKSSKSLKTLRNSSHQFPTPL